MNGKHTVVSVQAIRTLGAVELHLRPFLTSALDRGDCLCHGRFTPLEKVPGTRWVRSWLDPTDDMEVSENVPNYWQVSNFGSPIRKLCC